MTTEPVQEALSAFTEGATRPGEIRRGNRTLRWIEAGRGEPVVLLGSGAGDAASLAWAAVLPALAVHTRVVAYDRAGLGGSDPVCELSLDQALTDLVAVARSVSPRASILVGHSWGGLLSLLAASQHPELACGLVLVDPADDRYWQSLPPEAIDTEVDAGEELVRQFRAGELARTIRGMARADVEAMTTDPALQETLVEAYASCYATADQASAFLAETRMSLAAIPTIAAIRRRYPVPRVPLVVMSATRGPSAEQREAWTRAHGELVASARAGTHIVVDGTGHAIHQERPAEVSAAIAEMIERCRAGPATP